jgi:hypothetical protein
MQHAQDLPHYLADWEAALGKVQPGFTILSDMQVVNQANQALSIGFRAVEQLIVERGVRLVAEVHVPGLPTRRYSDEVTTSQAMPVHQFMNIWEAVHFLDTHELQLARKSDTG